MMCFIRFGFGWVGMDETFCMNCRSFRTVWRGWHELGILHERLTLLDRGRLLDVLPLDWIRVGYHELTTPCGLQTLLNVGRRLSVLLLDWIRQG